MALKPSTSWDHWPQTRRLYNGSMGELYLRAIVPTNFGNKLGGGNSRNHNSSEATHHFYSTYGIDVDILSHYAN